MKGPLYLDLPSPEKMGGGCIEKNPYVNNLANYINPRFEEFQGVYSR
jgi:hypothetical protein